MSKLFAIELALQRRKNVNGHPKGAAAAEDSLDIVATRFFEPADFRSSSTIVDHDGADSHVVRRDVDRFEERRAEGEEMSARSGRTFGENRDRLPAPKRFCDGDGLVLRALAVGTLDVDRAVLVGEPVNEPVAEFVLRNEGAADGPAEDQDIEPAGVVGNQQCVLARAVALQFYPGTANPRRSGKEPLRPGRAPQKQLRRDVEGSKQDEQQQ